VRNIEDEAVLAATTTGQFGPYADTFLEPPQTWGTLDLRVLNPGRSDGID
jgi:hypothetical protein